jgi:hypothetical protein
MANDLAVLCAKSWWISTYRATGARPYTSPPLVAQTIDLNKLVAPLVYIRLHGIAGQPYLYSDPGWQTTLSAAQIALTNWKGALVFMEGCYGGLMADAFLEGGARAVAGAGKSTWGKRYGIGPSSQVGREWLRLIRKGEMMGAALYKATKTVPRPFSDGWTVLGDEGARLQDARKD